MDNDTFERLSAMDYGGGGGVFDTYKEVTSGKTTDPDVQIVASLKKQYPELIVTSTPASNISLIQFATAGHATAELDLDDETIIRWRGYIPPPRRGGSEGYIANSVFFAKYRYIWGSEDFILYTASVGYTSMQYILKEPRGGEKVQDNSKATDALIAACGAWQSIESDALYVFDGYWYKSVDLWRQVQKASWANVILDPKMKKDLVSVSDTFFDSEQVYKDYGVPWKRGLIFHGPPGNGKTISIKALMHSMYTRKHKVPCLYVKSAPYTYMIANIFQLARSEAPCILIFEDIDTIVTPTTRAYFFNEVDGVANNDGILMVASTNYLDRLDPGLTKRPSRFDRKYLFPMPSNAERELYCEYWRGKVKNKPIDFPPKLCPAIADITDGFSFAYLQELFIASLLDIVRDEESEAAARSDNKHDDDDLDNYKLWRVIKRQVKALREDLDSGDSSEALLVESSSHRADQLDHPLASGRRDQAFPASVDGSALMHHGKAGYASVMQHQQQRVGTHGLTPEQAIVTLHKTNKLADRIYEWGPPPPPSL